MVRKLILAAGALGLLSACSTLPAAGPDVDDVKGKASIVANVDKGHVPYYAAIDLTADNVRYFNGSYGESLFGTFGGGRGPAPELIVGVGDVVQVTIFEASSGGLFIPSEAGIRPGNFVTMPQQIVDSAGFITVPYAGKIQAAGRTLPAIQDDIEQKLAPRAIEPQAVVNLVEQNAMQVSVVGEVNGSSKITIAVSGDRVLDMIAKAGGLRYPSYESYVTLTRRGRSSTVSFPTLIANPKENIFVSRTDTIFVYREQPFFVAVGASGLNGHFAFDQERLTLSEAIGKSGGLLDERANPAAVLLYRQEAVANLKAAGIEVSADIGPTVPVIYRLNVRNPAGFFAAQQFTMRNRDILYVSNADSVELLKFLLVVNAVSSTAAGVSDDVVTVKDNVKALKD
ncbi:sugar ABC transporter substrate-binding protein [Terrihabitans soli]|uniref:Sugar ABC transporter substrate-binding protein n=1 Tax=Terrihabitans soli TaxID=708113 RepID=A0A6S6QWH6_9HYPH|nr:polysaccharide biosynthesis/export family protein [Terrihabitans soli]BCJ91925.1 sugar ABC transporter substrate-binding protein [Terrihabitans soli]